MMVLLRVRYGIQYVSNKLTKLIARSRVSARHRRRCRRSIASSHHLTHHVIIIRWRWQRTTRGVNVTKAIGNRIANNSYIYIE